MPACGECQHMLTALVIISLSPGHSRWGLWQGRGPGPPRGDSLASVQAAAPSPDRNPQHFAGCDGREGARNKMKSTGRGAANTRRSINYNYRAWCLREGGSPATERDRGGAERPRRQEAARATHTHTRTHNAHAHNTHAHTYAHTRTHTAHMHTRTCTHMHMHTTHTHMHTHTHTHAHTHTHW